MTQEEKLEVKVTGHVGDTVPNYVLVAEKWYDHWNRTGDNRARMNCLYYRQVAVEMGQCVLVQNEAADA